MSITRIMLMLFALIAFAIATVSAQSAVSLSPDNRYDDYKGIKIEWPSSEPDLTACKAGEYYEPSATNLARFATPEDAVRLQEHDECTWMITTTGWRWVLRRAGTKVAVDKEGRDLYDLGRNDGKVCKNPRPFSVPYLPPVAEVVPPPAPEPCNCPPPAVVVEVVLPPWEPTELVAMPPTPPAPPTYDFQTALVWEEGKGWWWRYTPLFCVDVRSPKDLWRPALCAAVAAGGYALAGGFSGGAAAPLVKTPYLVPTIVP